MAINLPLLILTLLTTGCSATAPGDEDSRCLMQRSQPYPENVKVLMDSRNYEELLPGHSADPIPDVAWTDVSCDSSDVVPKPFSTPPYWQHGTGGLCTYQAQVCGYVATSGTQDNWLFTQYISKVPTAADTYNVRVYVNITYQFLSCRETVGCRLKFRLQNYMTNSEQQSLTCSQTSQFSGSAIMPSNIITGSSNIETSKTRYFDMTATQDGFYFALQDIGDGDLRGTCVAISRFIIYRHECRAQAVGLVRYAVTQAPASGTVSVTTQCVPNAQRSSSSLDVGCSSDGHWGSERPVCMCSPGYQLSTDGDGNHVCEICPAGTYKALATNTEQCKPCPSQSTAEGAGTAVCGCDCNFIRHPQRPDDPCTRPPSAPELDTSRVPTVSGTDISLSWMPSVDSGGTDSVHYNVYAAQLEGSSTAEYRKVNDEIITRLCGEEYLCYKVTTLDPETPYSLLVVAANNATDDPSTISNITLLGGRFLAFVVGTDKAATESEGLSAGVAAGISFIVTLIPTIVITAFVTLLIVYLFIRRRSSSFSTAQASSSSMSDNYNPVFGQMSEEPVSATKMPPVRASQPNTSSGPSQKPATHPLPPPRHTRPVPPIKPKY